MSDWKLSFRYRKGSDIDIRVHSDIGYPQNTFHIRKIRTQDTSFLRRAPYFSATVWFTWILDLGYRIKVYSDIQYNVGLCSLQSDIDIKLSLISLITDIGVSAHLCLKTHLRFRRTVPLTRHCISSSIRCFDAIGAQLCCSILPFLSIYTVEKDYFFNE